MAVDTDALPVAALPWPPLLPWQQTAARDLLAQRASWPHALLLYGPAGIGKHALALNLAQALLCEAPRDDGLACGNCPGCRYAVAGTHPDLLRIERLQVDDESGELRWVETIAIDRIRELIDFAQLSSHRRRAKVAVIAPAERMNAAAANALLKTLEEPPAATFLLLVSDQPARLPATIRSRCRKIAAPLPAPADARAWLISEGVEEPDLALSQARGAPLAARALADPAALAERKVWLAALAQPGRLSASGFAARIDAGGKEQRRARLEAALEWLLSWTADLARVRAGGEPRQNPDFAEALRSLAGKVAPLALFRYHRTLLGQRALMAHPLQPRLVAEALLIDYRDLFNRQVRPTP